MDVWSKEEIDVVCIFGRLIWRLGLEKEKGNGSSFEVILKNKSSIVGHNIPSQIIVLH